MEGTASKAAITLLCWRCLLLQKTVIIDNPIYSQKSVSEQERTFESALLLIHITPITAYFMEGGVAYDRS